MLDALYDVNEYYAQNNTSFNYPRHNHHSPYHYIYHTAARANNDADHRQDHEYHVYKYMDADTVHLCDDSDWSSADLDHHTHSASRSYDHGLGCRKGEQRWRLLFRLRKSCGNFCCCCYHTLPSSSRRY